MEITGLLLLLFGAALKSGNNVLMKKMTKEFGDQKELITAYIFTSVGLIALTAANAHSGVPQNIETLSQSTFWIALLPTMLLNIVIMYGNMYALSKADVSLIGPIIATTPLIVLIPAALILQEYPGTLGYTGLISCAIGLYVFAYNEQVYATSEDKMNGMEWKPPKFLSNFPTTAKILAPLLMLTKNQGVKIAMITAFCGAFAIIFDKKSTLMATTPFLPLGIIMLFVGVVGLIKNKVIQKKYVAPEFNILLLGVGMMYIIGFTLNKGTVYIQTPFLVVFFYNMHKQFRETELPIAITSLLIIVLTLFWFPFYYGQAAYVGSLKRLEVVFDLVFGYYVLKEKNVKQRIPGALLMMLGAICITLD